MEELQSASSSRGVSGRVRAHADEGVVPNQRLNAVVGEAFVVVPTQHT
jgi:hypothetical protein